MASLYDSVKEQAIGLLDGHSMRGVCPKCGAKEGTSFVISREGAELHFIDFSASCGFKGSLLSNGGKIPVGKAAAPKQKLCMEALAELEAEERDYLSAKFLIRPDLLNAVRFCERDCRVYYPQFTELGQLAGYIARWYDDLAMPGAKAYGGKALWKPVITNATGLLFPSTAVLKEAIRSSSLILLEDWPSTMRVVSQTGKPAACLGGTNIYPAHIDTLLNLSIMHITILLDADAVAKAVKLKRSMALAFPNTKVVPLTGADPKDMTIAELEATLYEGGQSNSRDTTEPRSIRGSVPLPQ